MCGISVLVSWSSSDRLRCRYEQLAGDKLAARSASVRAWWRQVTRQGTSSCAGSEGYYPEKNSNTETCSNRLGDDLETLWTKCCERIRNRGPDAYAAYTESLSGPSQGETARKLRIAASTLAIRSPTPASKQPVLSPSGRFVVAYNGELYARALKASTDAQPSMTETREEVIQGNDLEWLAHELDCSASEETDAPWHPGVALAGCIGPFALVIWDRKQRQLYFARDPLGRRSLVMAIHPSVGLVLCSVAASLPASEVAAKHGSEWRFVELPPLGGQWFVIDALKLELGLAADQVVCTPHTGCAYRPRGMPVWLEEVPAWIWVPLHARESHGLAAGTHDSLPKDAGCEHETDTRWRVELATELTHLLCRIVKRQASARRQDALRPALGVLFSGGIDSLVIARALDVVLPLDECIHLVHVSFHSADDTVACAGAAVALNSVDGAERPTCTAHWLDPGRHGLYPASESHSASQSALPTSSGSCLMTAAASSQDEHVLVNDPAPDTLQAQRALAFLKTQSVRPERYRFHHVRVPAAAVERDWVRLVSVVAPAETTPMDIALGACIWYAAAGAAGAHLDSGPSGPVRILFSGLGADELFAGYKGRHRSRFRQGGSDALFRELETDVNQLWWRNLGRDDRCAADHGCELRHPFLDEALIEWVRRVLGRRNNPADEASSCLAMERICDLSLPDGVGDKRILRLAATMPPLSIPEALAQTPKRAIQFGSRASAVLERQQRTGRTKPTAKTNAPQRKTHPLES